MKRAAKFIFKLIIAVIIMTAILFGLYYFNKIFKLWNITSLESQLKGINNVFLTQLAAGITVGTILLLLFIFIFPFFTKKINTREYLKNIILGIVASFVFFISQTVYHYFEKFGKFSMIISILAVTIITFIIIEIMSLTFNSEKREIAFRTAILGCIASGLIFGIVLNLVFLGMDYFKISVR